MLMRKRKKGQSNDRHIFIPCLALSYFNNFCCVLVRPFDAAAHNMGHCIAPVSAYKLKQTSLSLPVPSFYIFQSTAIISIHVKCNQCFIDKVELLFLIERRDAP